MALSSSESALLTETCTNMNIAANTCREVLEMLRNLGNTGVVDIATHNNAQTVHAGATNLMHVSNGVAYLGSKSGYWENNYPVELYKTNLDFRFETAAGDDQKRVRFFKAFTDSQNALLKTSEASAAFGNKSNCCDFSCQISLKNSSGSAYSATTGFVITAGTTDDLGDYSKTGITATTYNGSAVATPFEINSASVHPGGGYVTLGTSGKPFSTGYVMTAITVTSDAREKKGITGLDGSAVDFIKALRPVTYTLKNGNGQVVSSDENGDNAVVEVAPGVRQHWGFVAQEVKEAMSKAGIEDAAVWCLADKSDPDSKQMLRYEELIAPLVKAVQVLAAKVEALEGK